MNTINKERARVWVAALRSGDYKQASMALRVSDKFCCLGVLCDISKTGTWVCEYDPEENPLQDKRYYRVNGFEDYTQLPVPVRDWLGIPEGDPAIDIPETRDHENDCSAVTLAGLNDQGLTFNQIADVIWWQYQLGEE